MLLWLSRLLAGVFSVKSLLIAMVTITLGLIFYNLVCDILEEVLNYAITKMSGVTLPNVQNASFVGFAGWFFGVLRLPEIIAVIVSSVGIKFILRKIPFLRW